MESAAILVASRQALPSAQEREMHAAAAAVAAPTPLSAFTAAGPRSAVNSLAKLPPPTAAPQSLSTVSFLAKPTQSPPPAAPTSLPDAPLSPSRSSSAGRAAPHSVRRSNFSPARPLRPPPEMISDEEDEPMQEETVAVAAAAASSAFVFDPVEKPPRNEDAELALFPPFAALDKAVISALPLEVRRELAEIYKCIRARQAAAAEGKPLPPLPQSKEDMDQLQVSAMQEQQQNSANAAPVAAPVAAPAVVSVAQFREPDPVVPTVAMVPRAVASSAAAVAASASFAPAASRGAAAVSSVGPSFASAHASDELEWSQVDHSVLAELPESIQSELRAEARRRRQAQLVTIAPSKEHASRKRKAAGGGGSSAGGGGGGGAAAHHPGGGDSGKPVQVFKIASMFQRMEKRQKRGQLQQQQHSISAAGTNLSVPSKLTAQRSDLECEVVELSPPLRPAVALLEHRTAAFVALRPPVGAANAGPDAVNVDARLAAAVASLPAGPPPPKGFVRVDPKTHPLRYAQASTAAPNTPASPPIVVAQSAPVSPPSRPLPLAERIFPAEDDGVVAMDLSSEGASQPVKLEGSAELDAETVEPAAPLLGAALVDDAVATDGLAAAALPVNDESDADEGVPGAVSGAAYDSFGDVRPWLDEWLRSVATPPRESHVQLLADWLAVQLRQHRNLAGAEALLSYVRRWADARCALLHMDSSDVLRRTAQSAWQPAFDHLLGVVQPLVCELFGGHLGLRAFDAS